MRPLVTLILIAAAAYGAWHYGLFPGVRTAASPAGSESLRSLAASVRADEVVMNTTTACPHCAAAKGWLSQHGFAFTECNMDHEARCVDEFRRLGGDGTPLLLVRGTAMRDGFDSDQFLALLAR